MAAAEIRDVLEANEGCSEFTLAHAGKGLTTAAAALTGPAES